MNLCTAEGCQRPEWDVTVYKGSLGRVWFVGYCEEHADEAAPEVPAGFELYGGGGDAAVVREAFSNGF